MGTEVSYRWTRNGTPLTVGGGRLYYVNGTGTIVINETEIGDTGLYQCVVETTLPNVSAPALTTSSMVSEVTVTCKSHDNTTRLPVDWHSLNMVVGSCLYMRQEGGGVVVKVGGALVREGGVRRRWFKHSGSNMYVMGAD